MKTIKDSESGDSFTPYNSLCRRKRLGDGSKVRWTLLKESQAQLCRCGVARFSPIDALPCKASHRVPMAVGEPCCQHLEGCNACLVRIGDVRYLTFQRVRSRSRPQRINSTLLSLGQGHPVFEIPRPRVLGPESFVWRLLHKDARANLIDTGNRSFHPSRRDTSPEFVYGEAEFVLARPT